MTDQQTNKWQTWEEQARQFSIDELYAKCDTACADLPAMDRFDIEMNTCHGGQLRDIISVWRRVINEMECDKRRTVTMRLTTAEARAVEGMRRQAGEPTK